MKLLLSYLRAHLAALALGTLLTGLCLLICFLYRLPWAAIRYLFLLWAVFAGVMLAAGMLAVRRRHKQLTALRAGPLQALGELPEPRDQIESDYQELILSLSRELADNIGRSARDRQETIDYYTLWAHQIKTPISAMDLLLQHEEGPESGALRMELFYIQQYVDMVLSYLRLDSDFSDLVPARYDLDGILRQAVRKFAPLFIGKKLTLDYPPVGQTVLTDEKWLCFVAEQLLSNAVKYTPDGGTISIRWRAPAVLEIADTGIGIRAEDLPRVFEKGFTGYNGRQFQKSTGIGLYLCRRVCRMLGHGISIDARAGEGTRVRLDFGARELEGD